MEDIQQTTHDHGKKPKGGLITMPFIFANESCERLAMAGFQTNMITYLTQQLHMPMTKAANTLTNFGGTSSLTPLLGAFIADSFAGRFWTITVASIIYQIVSFHLFMQVLLITGSKPGKTISLANKLKGFRVDMDHLKKHQLVRVKMGYDQNGLESNQVGMISLTLSAILPNLRPPTCQDGQVCQEANTGQLAILYISLLLTAIGSGGIRPCVVTYGADQFDETDEKQKAYTWKFFNWYYFCVGTSTLVAVTIIVYIQDYVGWGWGLGVPSIAMAISIVAFVFGYPLYRNMDPSGSPFTRLVQVCVAAYKKRNLPMVSDAKMLYENEELDASISVAGRLLHTEQMKFLDKAAIVTQEDYANSQSKPNLWRLNTVHRVEELKSLLRMCPIWASGILLFTAYVQQNTFSLQQAKTMNRHLTKSFQIPAGSMSVFTLGSMLATILFYDRVFVPIMKRFTGVERGISFLSRMGIGFAI
uniref:Putative proton-dependent oligopeptide transporter family n=1 Tax=Helianthus annuus TaxID=4232 RepID=A0A251VIY6_HELAN